MALFASLAASTSILAATADLAPSADTYISTHFPGPNGEGADMVIGTQGSRAGFAQNRGLVRFDLSSIPAGAHVDSVSFEISLTKSPSFPPTANYQLHRFLTDWSESDATWGMRTVSDEWMSPGAEAGTEYSTNVSGSALIGSTGTFPFSGTGMATDVEFWIANPTANRGWLIKTEDESVELTARRVAAGPHLIVNYTVVAAPHIDSVALNNGQFCASFQARTGKRYVLERRADVDSGGWTEVANLPPAAADGPASLCDPAGQGNGFYRIGEQ